MSYFSVTDNSHANTPLHWALLSKNSYAVQLLMDKPGVDFQVGTFVGVIKRVVIQSNFCKSLIVLGSQLERRESLVAL